MLDNNAEIEQMIYTTGGNGKFMQGPSDFGLWGHTKGIDWESQRVEIQSIFSLIHKGENIKRDSKTKKVVDSSYWPETRRIKELKKDAKLGLFKKNYKDSDYEYKSVVTRNQLHILEQSKDGSLTGVDFGDYRENPQEAPHRIVYTKLTDGRLMVTRTSGINKVYSKVNEVDGSFDDRNGNYFAHSYIFPVGTEITDIDISKLQWKYGLESKYWKGNEKAPEFLETTTMNKMMGRQQTKNTAANNTTQNSPQTTKQLSPSMLLDVFKLSMNDNISSADRRAYKNKFQQAINNGANIYEVRKLAYTQLLSAAKNGEKIINYEEIVLQLSNISCKFDGLFDIFNNISNANISQPERENRISDLQFKMSRCDMDTVVQFAKSQKEMYLLAREYECLTNPTKKESDYVKNNLDASILFVTYCENVLQNQKQGEMEQ